MDGDVLTALVTALAAIVGMGVTYRLGRNSRREAQQIRFENFYARLSQLPPDEIVAIMQFEGAAKKQPVQAVMLAWYFTICETVWHGMKYSLVQKADAQNFLNSLRQKYRNLALLDEVLLSEGFDADFTEKFNRNEDNAANR